MTETIEQTLADRKNSHGEYAEHARCTQAIMDAVMRERNWTDGRLSAIQKESLHMFAHKMGRIAVGNPNHEDHWHDIVGYAQLVKDRLPKGNGTVRELKPHSDNITVDGKVYRDGRFVEYAPGHEPAKNATNTPRVGETQAEIEARERRVPRFPRDKTEDWDMRPRTPEDGGQHVSLFPWQVSDNRIFGGRAEVFDKFYKKLGRSGYVLEPHVESETILREVRDCYFMRGETWVIDIRKVPPDLREHYPSLQRERNMKEHEDLPVWQRPLYTWDETQTKFRLNDLMDAWHVEHD